MGQIGVFLGVSGRFSGYFQCIMGFFGYFLGWSVYFLGIFDGLGFKSAAWVSNRWCGFLISGLDGGSGGHCRLQLVCVWLYWWFGGLCLCVWLCWWFVFVCVCGSVCVVMGLDRLIGASWVSMCVALCVEPVPEVKGEREEKKWLLGKPRKMWFNHA